VNGELESIGKEAVVAEFEVLSWHLHAGTEENQENFNQVNHCVGRDSKLTPPQYESSALSLSQPFWQSLYSLPN
jgi:hypothetical protein